MIVGISGAQGQGKTTLIQEAVKADPLLVDAGFKTSRKILEDWGMTLDEVNRYLPLKVKFQDELFSRHYKTLQEFKTPKHVKLIERTFADIFVYALVSVGPFNEYSNWLDVYYYKCEAAQNELFDMVVYLSGRDYTPEIDGVRSVNTHFNALVDNLVYKYSMDFKVSSSFSNNVVHINEPYIDDRVRDLRNYIHEFKEGK